MAKNIVLFSDGTGNSGAKLNGTNVWRLFEALERTPPSAGQRQQIALYDDGVGTNSFKPLRLIGGAFGWGITANLERLYAYLIRNYEVGDDIYMFGFSRGAFTVRTLSNILFYCGLPSGTEQIPGATPSSVRRSPDEIAQMASDAVEAYKRRVRGRRDLGQPDELRKRFVSTKQGLADVPIKFLGVWDTVDAVGLPFDELTDAFSWFMPLRLDEGIAKKKGLNNENSKREQSKVLEDDLHDHVEFAYHALAIDDRRYTFHPVLFQEKYPLGSPHAGQPKPITQPIRANDGSIVQKLEQVWFAGMHSNVGGGYAQDAMSLVSLNWMLDRISTAAPPAEALRFTSLINDYKRDADHLGRMYDSRAGTGILYRYRPRSIQKLTNEYGCEKKQIHWTVLDRVSQMRETYLPADLPSSYEVVDAPSGFQFENNPGARFSAQQPALDQMFIGRIQYAAFVALFVFFGMWAWLNSEVVAEHSPNSLLFLLGWLEGFALNLASWVLPAYFESGVHAFRTQPGILTIGILLFAFLWAWSGVMLGQLRQIAHQAWSMSLPARQSLKSSSVAPSNFKQELPGGLFKSWLRDGKLGSAIGKANRGSLETVIKILMKPPTLFHQMLVWLVAKIGFHRLDKFFDWFNWRVAPPVAVVAVLLLASVLVMRGVWRLRMAIRSATDIAAVASDTRHEFEFDTTNPMQDSLFNVVKGSRYRIDVVVNSDWLDDTIPASPKGVEYSSPIQKILTPLRRSVPHPWLRLMMSVGPTNSNLFSVGEKLESFTAPTDGRLFFFVNDGPADWIYRNNHGTATITITRLDSPR